MMDRYGTIVSGDSGDRVRRRLAAILVAGYEGPSSGGEAAGFTVIMTLLSEVIEPMVRDYGGHLVNSTGERALIEFDSVVEAARCAAALRLAVAERNAALAPERRVVLRIGINLGDIIATEDDIFGDGVNIAARIEALADPGSVCIAEIVRDQIAGKVDFDFVDLGPQRLKNINRPIRVYRMGDSTAAAREPAEPAGPPEFDDRRAIAVLPFNNFSGDPEQDFFADGITEDIISLLAGWRAFPVIARQSTFTYKGQTVDVKKVGEDLGAFYVVEGSVRKSGRRMRVTAQLIQAATGHHIMAERYDRDLTDLFELQDEITSAIAGAIEPELLKFERDRIAEQPQHNEDAYALYQHGMWHHYRHTKEDNIEAQSYFRRALALDPQYPQATAALSLALCNAGYLAWAQDQEASYAQSYELGQRAVALDVRYPAARFALALVCAWTGRSDRSVAEFREAINLNPSYAAAHVILGSMLNYRGQSEEGLALIEKGIRLSPSDPRLFMWLPPLAATYYQLRDYPKSVEIARRSWTLKRNWPQALPYLVAGLAQLGQIDEARGALEAMRELDPNLSLVRTTLKRLYTNQAGIDHLLDGLHKAGFE
jgi:adenylate cyclase